MRNFLWCPGDSARGKAKVAWDVVCLPKDEGGLGIRRLDHFNSALMVSHIWKLLSLKESLWVKWIHCYKLQARNFWEVPLRGNMSCGWRNILQLRPSIRDFIWQKIGTGACTSLWFDKWCPMSPLSNHISNRDIHRAGLSFDSKVADIVHNNVWTWPTYLMEKYQFLSTCNSPISTDQDCVEWRSLDGTALKFSVSTVWDSIRPRDNKVWWYNVVWFTNNIPRHAVNLWLIIKRRLKTQDRVNIWNAQLGSTCSLCNTVPDSHDHIFFQCPFAASIWNHMKKLVHLDNVSNDVYAIIDHLGNNAHKRATKVVFAKLVLAASAYFLWQERNWRLFKKMKRSHSQVIECITSAVRLKLLSCRFKRSKEGVAFARVWSLPDSVFR